MGLWNLGCQATDYKCVYVCVTHLRPTGWAWYRRGASCRFVKHILHATSTTQLLVGVWSPWRPDSGSNEPKGGYLCSREVCRRWGGGAVSWLWGVRKTCDLYTPCTLKSNLHIGHNTHMCCKIILPTCSITEWNVILRIMFLEAKDLLYM